MKGENYRYKMGFEFPPDEKCWNLVTETSQVLIAMLLLYDNNY